MMLSLFAVLVLISALWEFWVLWAFIEGTALHPEKGAALWWIGFSANGALLLWMLIDCLMRPLRSNIRSRWIFAITFLGVPGSCAYFFLVKMKEPGTFPKH